MAKNWTPEEIAGAKQAGIFLSNPTPKVEGPQTLDSFYKSNPAMAPKVEPPKVTSNTGTGGATSTVTGNGTTTGTGTTNDIAKIVANGTGTGTGISTGTSGQQNKVETKPYEKAVDNTAMINSQADQMAAAIRAKIEQRNRETRARITALPEKYQPDKNASEVAKAQQVRSLNEIAANQGDRGGIGRQNTLSAMIGGENRLNSVNLAQKQEEAALNNEIGRLMLEGDIQEANIQAQRLRDLIENNTSMNNTNYERQFNAEGRQQTQGNWLSEFDQRQEAERQAQQNWTTTNTQNQDQNKLTNTRYDENVNYNQGRDKVSDTLAANKAAYEKQINDRDFQYTVNKDRGYVNPTAAQEVPAEVRQALSVYSDDYAQAEKELMASGQVELAKYAQVLRNEKMFNPMNPELLQKYGQPFQTLQNQQVQSGIATEVLQRAAMTIDNLAKQYNLENILPQELARAKQLISIGEAELAAKIFENSKAPEEFKMKMATMAEQISASKSNTSQGWSRVANDSRQTDTSAGKLELDKQVRNDALTDKSTANTIKGIETRNVVIDPLTKQPTVNYNGIKKELEIMQNNKVNPNIIKEYANYFGIAYE